jgi:PH (Pleckstrin Homology) domain-containing protein
MLNTDLHLADHDQHMTRNQFVKNTLPTIRSIAELANENNDTVRIKDKTSSTVPNTPQYSAVPSERPSLDYPRKLSRSVNRSDSDGLIDSLADGSNLLVLAPYEGPVKGWDAQVETILKEFYNSIRSERLPLHGSNANDDAKRQQSNGNLSVMASALRRTPSVLSKAPSEAASFRGRPGEMRSATGRFTSKSRTRPRLYPSSTVGSSRTSLDDQSMWSPAPSIWTKYSLGKTQTSFSVESLGSWGRGSGFPQPIGFANAINQAMLREEGGKDGSDSVDFGRSVPLLEDETLELHGPPWAKEGLVRHKVQDKRTKDRGWAECFAVIEKGQMRLFSFTGQHGHSVKGALRHFRPHKSKPSHGSTSTAGAQVKGGGNWLENAQDVASFTLRQTYATTLAREHSKTQAFVWALTLPTGAVHAFAVGSNELREEWISTANYWSARLSKEPLIGGVSNIEYGWGDPIISGISDASSIAISSPPQTATSSIGNVEPMLPGSAHSASNSRSVSRTNSVTNGSIGHRRSSFTRPPPSASSRPASSIGRGSLDQNTARIRLPGDKVMIADWRPPVSSMMPSQLMEVDQRNALQAYVIALDDELKKHNELRPLMSKAVSWNHVKASFFLPFLILFSFHHVIQMQQKPSTTGIISVIIFIPKSSSTRRILKPSTMQAKQRRRSMSNEMSERIKRKKMMVSKRKIYHYQRTM